MEVIPGVKARTVRTDEDEVAEIAAKLADRRIVEAEEREKRKTDLLASVVRRLRRGDGPVRVTEEMVELGIAERVWSLVQQAELARKFDRLAGLDADDEPDDRLDEPGAWLG